MARSRRKPTVPGLHCNTEKGAIEFIVPASSTPTKVRVSKIPKKTNKLAVQSSAPVEFGKG